MTARRTDLSRRYGEVRITEESPPESDAPKELSFSSCVQASRYRWTPPDDIRKQMPPALEFIDFLVELKTNGQRLFVPVHHCGEVLVQHAFAAGMALWIREGSLDPTAANSIRVMKLVYDRVRGMQEHCDREFRDPQDLYIRKSGRGGEIGTDVLPADLGCDEAGEGRRWSVSRLIQEGDARAQSAGLTTLTADVKIPYGLLAAAERNPLYVDKDEVRPLMLMALFDTDQTELRFAKNIPDAVFERFVDAFQEHLDEPFVAFDAWYSGPKSNLFKSLAKRAGYPDGKLDHASVRGAFLRLGWQAYGYVANCVNYFAQAFMNSLPEPLSTEERQLFSHMYQPQPYLGGLPLVMILERSKLIAPVIRDLWEMLDDRRSIAVLHRLLSYYFEMVRTRRQADRQFKERSHGRTRPVRELTNQRNEDAPQEPNDLNLEDLHGLEDLHAVIRSVLRRRGVGCAKCNAPLELKILSTDKKWRASGTIEVSYWCPDHKGRRKAALTLEELRSAAKGEVPDGG